jgi:virginiamycin B lyase
VIVAGPDGALWFANLNAIGRITTSGKLTFYRGHGIDDPQGITAGPGRAMWFTNFDGGSIGRTTCPDPGSPEPNRRSDQPHHQPQLCRRGWPSSWTRQGRSPGGRC